MSLSSVRILLLVVFWLLSVAYSYKVADDGTIIEPTYYSSIEECLEESNKCYQGGCTSTLLYCGDCWYEYGQVLQPPLDPWNLEVTYSEELVRKCPEECNTVTCQYYGFPE